MSTNPAGFRSALSKDLTSIRKRTGLSEDKAFNVWFATQILDIDETTALEGASVEGANDKGIDLFFINDDDEKIVLLQGKHSAALNYKPKERELNRLISGVMWLQDPVASEREGRAELAQAACDFVEAEKKGYGVDLVFAYCGPLSKNIEKAIRVYNQNKDNLQNRRTIRQFDVDIMKDLWFEVEGGRKRIESDHVTVSGDHFETYGGFGKAVVATVDARELVRFYEKYRDKLFDRNVRLFLGARKGSVNARMAKTIQDPKQRPHFWAFNNGVTIICDDYEIEAKGESISLVNFSIVNGCQTTVSLANNLNNQNTTQVLVKCIAAPAGIIDDIILSTNSQNPIKSWDIASQHKTQRRLKSELEKLSKPVHYVTRRGSSKRGQIGTNIKLEQAGQFVAAFKGSPVLAYMNKAFIFSEYHDEVFPQDIKANEVLLAITAGNLCKQVSIEFIKNSLDKARIFKRGGHLFILAILSELLRKRNGSTYLTSLSEEQISSKKGQERLLKYARLAAQLYFSAVTDEAKLDPQKRDVTVLVRQKEFFQKVSLRAVTNFETLALNADWIKGVLPQVIR